MRRNVLDQHTLADLVNVICNVNAFRLFFLFIFNVMLMPTIRSVSFFFMLFLKSFPHLILLSCNVNLVIVLRLRPPWEVARRDISSYKIVRLNAKIKNFYIFSKPCCITDLSALVVDLIG